MSRLPSDPILRALLVLLLVWPPLHMVGTTALDVSSWRLGGWGMYATALPRRQHVAVIARDCALPLATTDDRTGLATIVFGSRGIRESRLPIDAGSAAVARDVAAFRRREDVVTLVGRLRRLHGIPPESPLLIAVAVPRVDTSGHVAYAHARAFVVANGAVVDTELTAASLARFDALLPECGVSQ